MKNMATTMAICALALTLGALGWAQDKKHEGKGQKGPGLMQQADANKDGKVTFEEIKAVRPKMTQERFKEMDTNKDGVLDKADHPQGKPGQHGPAGFLAMLKQADKDGNEKVTFEELKAVRPKMTEERFKAMDKDKDGVLTKADAPKEAPAASEKKDGKPAAKPGEKPATKPEGKSGEKPGGKLKAADVNNDGKVTFDELKAANPEMTQEKFNKLDKDGDGAITQADKKKPS